MSVTQSSTQKTIPILYDPVHNIHDVGTFEKTERAENIFQRLSTDERYHVVSSFVKDMNHITAIHEKDYVDYLRLACEDLQADQIHRCEIVAYDRAKQRKPKSIKAQIGWYCYETTTGICKGTYEASVASAFVALSGASLLRGSNSVEDRGEHDLVYSICRPPGHHATSSRFGGFCYLNNAALAAHYLTRSKPDDRNGEKRRVAVLDIDYHGGNGTQEIFYDRDDVFVVSIHGDPDIWLGELYFWGYSDEIGEGPGKGFNLNLPVDPQDHGAVVDYKAYEGYLDRAIKAIREFSPEFLVISFGVDTSVHDPLGIFAMQNEDYHKIGSRVRETLKVPTLVVQEGGYHPHLGECAHQLLQGLSK
ncbi:deacetylase, histone deacetylase/acetoin utilization protein [Planoprotostelium fungivorum]|uniref:Deacetylase, histone deacetylase/acetoin utilization protein n=1 Tax=Planoprotostelium fungivorum TaxID=1890364 RepID=A0A2P6N1Y2_9EUKA|nr:deacetylase, histone deacetylase/acetoin utilization protein [Planoprotostelium fungivorum]